MADANLTRESWLQSLVALLRAHFETAGIALPVNIHVSVGWPSRNPRKVMGQCWEAAASADGSPQIFISPTIGDTLTVAGTLVHELLHASGINGHGPNFRVAMRKVGLEGKPRATEVGDELADLLRALLKTLPEYPHAALTMGEGKLKKQTTRMLLLQVDHPEPTTENTDARCTYSVRTTKKHIDVGLPMCPHGVVMELVDGTEEEKE